MGNGLCAATFIATNTTLVAVQAAVNSALDGDTVLVPAGASTWAGGVLITNAITFQGAGMDQTIIAGTNNGTIDFNLRPGKAARMTGFRLDGQAIQTWLGLVQVTGGSKVFRMDHCLFTNSAGWAVVTRDICGVIDHCSFRTYGGGVIVFHEAWGGASNYWGDGSWNDSAQLGTTNALYVEDCYFDGGLRNGAIDSVGGAHWVFRQNTVIGDIVVCHGTDSSQRERGTRSIEYYNNAMIGVNIASESFEMRSGTGVIFSNALSNYALVAALKEYRSPESGVSGGGYPPWGPANGQSVYDGNTDFHGYPCIDQCGRGKGDLMYGTTPTPAVWPHQASEPIYAWGNTLGGLPARIGSIYAVIQENRDFYNGKPMPGYTPLQYPHPLVAGAAASKTSPVISILTSSLDFGTVAPNTSNDLTLTLRNIGNGILAGVATAASPFSIVSGGSYSLGTNQSQIVTVRYTPLGSGVHSGTVTFTGGGGAFASVSGRASQ
jgi:hypothetical protein